MSFGGSGCCAKPSLWGPLASVANTLRLPFYTTSFARVCTTLAQFRLKGAQWHLIKQHPRVTVFASFWASNFDRLEKGCTLRLWKWGGAAFYLMIQRWTAFLLRVHQTLLTDVIGYLVRLSVCDKMGIKSGHIVVLQWWIQKKCQRFEKYWRKSKKNDNHAF